MSTNAPARSSSRRSVLIAGISGIAAGAATFAGHVALAGSPPVDPILALIEAEGRAWSALGAASRASDSVEIGREPTAEEEEACDRAFAAHDAAFDAVMRCRATTAAGAVAAMDLFLSRDLDHVPSPVDASLFDLFASIRAHLGVAAAPAGDVA